MVRFFLSNKFLLLIIFTLICIQFISLGNFPLIDTTEARYSGISLNMILNKNWQVPMFLSNIPYLGKPPFVFWCQALSLKLFGLSELAFRIPFFIIGILILLFTYLLSRTYFSQRASIFSVLITFSSALFFIESSTASIDIYIAFFVLLAFYIFRLRELSEKKNLILFDLSLGITFGLGFMTKGLVPLLYFLCPYFLYLLIKNKSDNESIITFFKSLFSVNWILVALLIVVVSAPWFYSVEYAYPGFLKYFFYNEHFLRFVSKNYGDLYGSGHLEPPGMSWIFTFGSALPWTICLIPILVKYVKNFKTEIYTSKTILFFWAFFPALMFTPSKQILMAYFSLSVPPIAILIGNYIDEQFENSNKLKMVDLLPLLISNIGIGISALIIFLKLSKALLPYQVIVLYFVLFCVFVFISVLYFKSKNEMKLLTLLILPMFCIPVGCSLWFHYYFNSDKTTRSTKQLLLKLKEKNPNYLQYPMHSIEGNLPYSFYLYRALYVLDLPDKHVPNDEKILLVHDDLHGLLKEKYSTGYVFEALVSSKNLTLVKVKKI